MTAGYTSKTLMAVDANSHSYLVAAMSWARQNRPDQMRACIAKLDRDEVLAGLVAWRHVGQELIARQALLADAALVELRDASPDGLPDGVVGFEIYGRLS